MNTVLLHPDASRLSVLQGQVAATGFCQVVQAETDALALLPGLQKQPPHLLVAALGHTGFNALHLVRALPQPPLVVFLIHEPAQALECYDMGALDCLLDTAPEERLLRGLGRAWRQHQLMQDVQPAASLPPQNGSAVNGATVNGAKAQGMGTIYVRSDYKQVRIDLDQVVYVQALKDYVKIYLHGSGRPVLTQMNLKQLEDRLPATHFARVHRSYIIALSQVTAVTRTEVTLGTTPLPLGEFYRQAFFRQIGQ